MTKEEAREAIKEAYGNSEYTDEIIKALEQEPCEDEYIKVPKNALKYRTAGMVAYNAEWLKNHFDIERAVICGAQEPCNAVSREAVLDLCDSKDPDYKVIHFKEDVECLPPVNPQPKIGYWIDIDDIESECSECGHREPNERFIFDDINYCAKCGAKMIDD